MSRYRTATRILAEVIASDASWLMVFNGAIDHIIQNNPKARQNPRGLSQLDGYKRGLVNSLTGNLQKFGLDRAPRVKTLDELLQDDETSENSTQDSPESINATEHRACRQRHGSHLAREAGSTPSPNAPKGISKLGSLTAT